MSRTVPSWLNDPVAIIVGEGDGVEAIAHELAAAGATIARGPYASSLDEAGAAIDKASAAARDPVTLLVHAEPACDGASAETMTLEAWRGRIGQAFDSRFFYASALANRLFTAGEKGSILFICHPAEEGDTAAMTAAGGVHNLVRTLSVEWARDGIRVNAIASRLLSGGSSDDLRSLGALASYLMSEYAAYVTGSITGVGINDVRS